MSNAQRTVHLIPQAVEVNWELRLMQELPEIAARTNAEAVLVTASDVDGAHMDLEFSASAVNQVGEWMVRQGLMSGSDVWFFGQTGDNVIPIHGVESRQHYVRCNIAYAEAVEKRAYARQSFLLIEEKIKDCEGRLNGEKVDAWRTQLRKWNDVVDLALTIPTWAELKDSQPLPLLDELADLCCEIGVSVPDNWAVRVRRTCESGMEFYRTCEARSQMLVRNSRKIAEAHDYRNFIVICEGLYESSMTDSWKALSWEVKRQMISFVPQGDGMTDMVLYGALSGQTQDNLIGKNDSVSELDFFDDDDDAQRELQPVNQPTQSDLKLQGDRFLLFLAACEAVAAVETGEFFKCQGRFKSFGDGEDAVDLFEGRENLGIQIANTVSIEKLVGGAVPTPETIFNLPKDKFLKFLRDLLGADYEKLEEISARTAALNGQGLLQALFSGTAKLPDSFQKTLRLLRSPEEIIQQPLREAQILEQGRGIRPHELMRLLKNLEPLDYYMLNTRLPASPLGRFLKLSPTQELSREEAKRLAWSVAECIQDFTQLSATQRRQQEEKGPTKPFRSEENSVNIKAMRNASGTALRFLRAVIDQGEEAGPIPTDRQFQAAGENGPGAALLREFIAFGMIATTGFHAAMEALDEGNADLARIYFTQEADRCADAGYEGGQSVCLLWAARVYAMLSQLDDARDCFRESREIASTSHNLPLRCQSLEGEIALLKRMGITGGELKILEEELQRIHPC